MNFDIIKREIVFKAVPSSGPGGQHANKVSTKVQLEFNLVKNKAFTVSEHYLVLSNLEKCLTKDGILKLSCQESRSQSTNKELVLKRLFSILQKSSIPKKIRKKRAIPKAVKRKRLNDKKKHSEKSKIVVHINYMVCNHIKWSKPSDLPQLLKIY